MSNISELNHLGKAKLPAVWVKEKRECFEYSEFQYPGHERLLRGKIQSGSSLSFRWWGRGLIDSVWSPELTVAGVNQGEMCHTKQKCLGRNIKSLVAFSPKWSGSNSLKNSHGPVEINRLLSMCRCELTVSSGSSFR